MGNRWSFVERKDIFSVVLISTKRKQLCCAIGSEFEIEN
jgi:hypothetical protein